MPGYIEDIIRHRGVEFSLILLYGIIHLIHSFNSIIHLLSWQERKECRPYL